MANGGSDNSNLDDSSEAAMSLAVHSKDELQLTVTKTCLDVFTKLGAVSTIINLIFFVCTLEAVWPSGLGHWSCNSEVPG